MGVLGDILNTASSWVKTGIDLNRDEKRYQEQKEREDTAVQRKVQDMQNAGLSPLADIQGSSANATGSGGLASANETSIEGNWKAEQQEIKSKDLINEQQEIANMKARTEQMYLEQKLRAELESTLAETKKKMAEEKESNSRGDYFESMVPKNEKEIERLQQEIEESKARETYLGSQTIGQETENKIKKQYGMQQAQADLESTKEGTNKTKAERYLTEEELNTEKLQQEIMKVSKTKMESLLPYEIKNMGLQYEKMAKEMYIDYAHFEAVMNENGWSKNNKGEWQWSRIQADKFYKGKNGVMLGTNLKYGTLR